MADSWRPSIRSVDLAVAGVIYLAAVVFAWVLAGFVPDYAVLSRDTGQTRYLPFAYFVGWFGITVTLMVIPLWVLRAVRLGQRAWPTALVAFPLLVESWVLGLLTAVVAVSL
ncbi:hypothetical protein OHB26_12200 [Nocardia sp. NBC_01503]|uniref:hypothetical protein n=1 Tax=Nocardia sp. NBC_01503 TaxID=2975997 RepID=UPI002E7AD232|nr:hypothetical protein [Nocardia sp. NBC_01503]WTL34881.1 hypothetical protein OHB26_12200 [Nocardia sp. NBC_01503]